MTTSSASSPLPRNTRLSAFYNNASLSQPPTPTPTHVLHTLSPGPSPVSTPTLISRSPSNSSSISQSELGVSTSLPTKEGKEAVINHVNGLTKKLTLPSLMTLCSTLREQSNQISKSLQTTSIQSYKQLTLSNEASKNSQHISSTVLNTNVNNIHQVCDLSTDINNNLLTSRKHINSLFTVQTLSSLLQISSTLSVEIQRCANHIVQDIITANIQQLIHHLFITCKRCFVVFPTLKQLAPHSPHFQTALDHLQTSMISSRHLVVQHFQSNNDNANDSVLSIIQICKIRTWLMDDHTDIKNDAIKYFIQYVTSASNSISDNAVDIAMNKNQSNGVANMYAYFAKTQVIPKLHDIIQWYTQLFNHSDANNSEQQVKEEREQEAADSIIIWLNEIVEDSITSKIRSSFQQIYNDETDSTGVHSLIKTIQSFTVSSSSTSSASSSSNDIVNNVLQACVDGLLIYIQQVIHQYIIQQIYNEFKTAVINHLTAHNSNNNDMNHGHGQGQSIQSSSKKLRDRISTVLSKWTFDDLDIRIEEDEHEIIETIIKQKFKNDKELKFDHFAYAAKINDSMPSSSSQSSDMLREYSKRYAHEYIINMMISRLDCIIHPDPDSNPTQARNLMDIINAFQYAEQIGRSCDISALKRARDIDILSSSLNEQLDHDDVDDDEVTFLDDGWLGRVVIKQWLTEIQKRSSGFTSGIINTLKSDATALIDVVGYDVTQKIDQIAATKP